MATPSAGSAVATGTRPPGRRGARPAGFVVGFDGLRAIAALLVVVVHVGAASGFTFRSSLGQYTARGEIGVSVFFLISGFLLYRPFAAAALAGRPGPNVRSYLVRRALRIVPLYWVALVVTYLFTGWASVHGVSGFLENAFFLQVYSRQWVFHGITQAWSLCIEVTFYLALPVWAACDAADGSPARRGSGPMIRRRCCAASWPRSPCCTSPASSSGCGWSPRRPVRPRPPAAGCRPGATTSPSAWRSP